MALNIVPLYAQTPGITAQVDRTTLTTDEVLVLTVVVVNSNNLRPQLPALDGLRITNSSSSSQVDVDTVSRNVTTTNTFRYVLQPTRSGNLQINPIQLNVNGQMYSTAPINIQVSPGIAPALLTATLPQVVPATSTPNTRSDQQPDQQPEVQGDIFVEALVDNPYLGEIYIRPIKPTPARLATTTPLWIENPLYWVVWLFPLLLLAVDAELRDHRHKRVDSAEMRRTQAQSKARALLNQARKEKGDPYKTVDVVLTGYLTDRLNQTVSGMTQNVFTNKLQEQNIEDSLITRVQDMLLLCKMGRFAPGNDQSTASNDLLEDAEKLIGDLEKGR